MEETRDVLNGAEKQVAEEVMTAAETTKNPGEREGERKRNQEFLTSEIQDLEEPIGQKADSQELEEPAEAPKRPRKPHYYVRPCLFWSRHRDDEEGPCQGWIVTPYDTVCQNCCLAGRRFRPRRKITEGIVEKTLRVAIGEKDEEGQVVFKGVFHSVLSEFVKTPGYQKAKEAALVAVELFRGREVAPWIIYGAVQRAVAVLLIEEQRWLHNELLRSIQADSRNRKEERLDELKRAWQQAQKRIFQGWEKARKTLSGYPNWGSFVAFGLRNLYVREVRRNALADQLQMTLRSNSIPRSRKRRMDKD